MMRIFSDQLTMQLHKELHRCYFLLGNDPLLLQESQDVICRVAGEKGFNERLRFTLDTQTDWNDIYSACQALSLFSSRQMLLLQLPDNGPPATMNAQLLQLSTLLHDGVLLVFYGLRLSKSQENADWFKALSQNGLQVNCQSPEPNQLPQWVMRRANLLQLQLDEPSCQLLCYCYEGNLLALAQALERLSLIYPDGKLTLPRVERAVNDAAHFTPYHWLDALLGGKSGRAWHVLHQLQQEEFEPLILFRTLQKELLLLLTLKEKMASTPLRPLFDQYKVWQNRRPLLTEALQRLSHTQLKQAITLLAKLEIILKQDFGKSVWDGLETLTLLLCGKSIPLSMIDD